MKVGSLVGVQFAALEPRPLGLGRVVVSSSMWVIMQNLVVLGQMWA